MFYRNSNHSAIFIYNIIYKVRMEQKHLFPHFILCIQVKNENKKENNTKQNKSHMQCTEPIQKQGQQEFSQWTAGPGYSKHR